MVNPLLDAQASFGKCCFDMRQFDNNVRPRVLRFSVLFEAETELGLALWKSDVSGDKSIQDSGSVMLGWQAVGVPIGWPYAMDEDERSLWCERTLDIAQERCVPSGRL